MHTYKQVLNDECVYPIISVTMHCCAKKDISLQFRVAATITHLRLLVYMVMAMTEGAQL